jgi:hypothetical protein
MKMINGFFNIPSRSILDWTNGFAEVYKEPDSFRKPEEFWNATMAHLSGIGESIRRTHYRDLLDCAGHTFCWMCCYVACCNKTDDPVFSFKNSLSEIIGLKFPEVCGHCRKNECVCSPVMIDKQRDKSALYQELYDKWTRFRCDKFSISQWMKIFWSIYSGQIHLQSLESIGFHLLEEAGEEAKAVRGLIQFRGILDAKIDGLDETYLKKLTDIPGLINQYIIEMEIIKSAYSKDTAQKALRSIPLTALDPCSIKARLVKSKIDFIIELADTFSFFCSVLLKLKEIIENERLDGEVIKDFHLEEVLKDIYKSSSNKEPLKCYSCSQTSCQCKFFPIPTRR